MNSHLWGDNRIVLMCLRFAALAAMMLALLSYPAFLGR